MSQNSGYETAEVILRLRNWLYCDQPMDAILASPLDPEDPLHEVVAALRQGWHQQALDRLAQAAPETRINPLYWLSLARARLSGGDRDEAVGAVGQILSLADLETRWHLQSWSILRELGHEPPPEQGRRVLGVVVEMGMEGAAAIVAGYADGDARMFWGTGGGLVGRMIDPDIQRAAQQLVTAAQGALPLLTPSSERPLVRRGRIQVAALTPAGAYIYEGSLKAIEHGAHPLHPVYGAMHELLHYLIRLYEQGKGE